MVRQGPLASCCWSRGARHSNPRIGPLLSHLREPIGVALANTARVRELKRLRESLEADKQALLSKLGRHDVADAVVGTETGLRAVMDRVDHVAVNRMCRCSSLGRPAAEKRCWRARSTSDRGAPVPLGPRQLRRDPAGLVESELFGRGGSTDGLAVRQGWLARADGGTLFLDEISELSLEAQGRASADPAGRKS